MNLRYSRHSIRFLEVMCTLGTVLTILPAYNFDKNRIVGRKLYKVYTVTWALISTSTVYYWTHSNWMQDAETLKSPLAFLMFLHEYALLALCVVISLGSAFWNMDYWKNLFQRFSLIEKYFNSRSRMEKSLLNNTGLQFLIFNLLVLPNCFYSIYLWFEASDFKITSNVMLAFSNMALLYNVYVKNTIIYNVALAIRCKYQDLNNFLIEGCSDGRMEMMTTLKTASYLYGLINKLVGTFNKLFGFEILLGLLHASILILASFSFVLVSYSHKPEDDKIHANVPVYLNMVFIIVGITTVVGQLQVMFSCHCAVEEAGKIIGICYKYQQHFAAYSKEQLELLILAHQAIYNKPAFCAAGFFEINRKTLFALIGTTTTYFIVLIQLNQN